MTTIMTLRRKRQSPEATPSCFRRLDLWSRCRNALYKSQLMRIIVLIMMIVVVVHNICHICHVFTRAWALTVRVWHKVEFYCTLDMWHSDIISWITPAPPTPPPLRSLSLSCTPNLCQVSYHHTKTAHECHSISLTRSCTTNVSRKLMGIFQFWYFKGKNFDTRFLVS